MYFLYIWNIENFDKSSCAMTWLPARRLNNETQRAQDGQGLSNDVPGSQLVTPRLSPVSEQGREWFLLMLFDALSQQLPDHNLCRVYHLSVIYQECKDVLGYL